MSTVMNLYHLLNKFGSRLHYFDIFIECNGTIHYKLKIFKNGYISEDQGGLSQLDVRLDKNHIKANIDGLLYSFLIPNEFNNIVPYDKYLLYIPLNDHNREIYNMLLRRKDVYLDSRLFDRSVWTQFKHLKLC